MPDLTWACWGLASAVLAAFMMLLQERLKVEGFALALWCKVACVIVTLPFVIVYGLPADPRFYAWISLQALIFAISDVVFFRHLPDIGAGVISRVLPGTVILGFFLWFAVEPDDIRLYLEQPVIAGLICAVLSGATFFAMRLKRCAVSMRAVRVLWFVIFAATVGPLLAKITTRYAGIGQGAFGFTFSEALMMICMWLVYIAVRRPVSFSSLVQWDTVRKSLLIGIVTASLVCVFVASYYYIDNPGYISALQLVSAVIILAVHRRMGKRDDSDVAAGFGIVACAMALIVLKAQMG
jgi:hypothetical protein